MLAMHERRRGFTLIELLVVIVIIGILAAIALPNYIKVKEKAKEAEVKANLHNIQLSTERFAVDSGGTYPSYLIGGESKYAADVYSGSSANAFTDIRECDPIEGVSDPLLRKGYVDAYPRNPFVRSGIAIHQVQESLPSSTEGEDPLRNAYPDSERLGTRFGAYCTSMGSVLADPRYTEWYYIDPDDGLGSPAFTWANIEYEFWDMWIGNKPLPYLPGEFFYKGAGPIMSSGQGNTQQSGGSATDGQPVQPIEIDQYALGGYGGIRTKGHDVLGAERPIVYMMRGHGGGGGPGPEPQAGDAPSAYQGGSVDLQQVYIWPWTRSEVSSSDEDINGSPFLPAAPGDGNEQLQYGNRNGFRDGIILVLTSGEDNRNDL